MFVTPKVIAIFLSKLKTHYFNIAFYFYNHIIYQLNCLKFIFLCTAPLSYGWGGIANSDDMI